MRIRRQMTERCIAHRCGCMVRRRFPDQSELLSFKATWHFQFISNFNQLAYGMRMESAGVASSTYEQQLEKQSVIPWSFCRKNANGLAYLEWQNNCPALLHVFIIPVSLNHWMPDIRHYVYTVCSPEFTNRWIKRFWGNLHKTLNSKLYTRHISLPKSSGRSHAISGFHDQKSALDGITRLQLTVSRDWFYIPATKWCIACGLYIWIYRAGYRSTYNNGSHNARLARSDINQPRPTKYYRQRQKPDNSVSHHSVSVY
jgi:hypothetical protein